MSKPKPKQNRAPRRPRRDWHKTVVAILAMLMALLMILPMISVVFQTAGALSESELQQQINAGKTRAADLNSQIKKLSEQLKSIQSDKAKALDQKNLLEQQINALNQSISTVSQTIAQYDQLIAEKEAEVAETQRREEEQYALFCERVRIMEEMGTVSYLDILFGASSFGDLLDRATMVSEIMDYDQGVMDQLAATKRLLQDQQAQLELTRTEQQAEKDELEAQKGSLKAKEAEVDKLIADIKADEAATQKAEAALKAEADKVTAEIVRKQKELQAKLDAGAITFVTGDGWMWPLPGYYRISSYFGNRIHPITGRPNNHSGTDIPAPGGTSIRAARGGVVTISTYGSSYGNYVVVQHDNGVSTLYAHMSSRSVKEGDVVKQGQTIGRVGTTGSSTGNHLHFEFRVNGTRKDALSYYPELKSKFFS